MIVQTLMGSGAEPPHIDDLEVCVRSLVVFGFAILAARLATRRFLSPAAPFDVILGVMLGAALSRAINGPSPLILAMAGAILLALVYRLFGPVSVRDRRPGEDGQRNTEPRERRPDLEPSPTQSGADLGGASSVSLLRSGQFSVLRRP
ncbi:MAG TPA: hypothetical protein VGH03_13915 [Caulobacteraceae bacterium]|jgi:hypothetical protein